MTVIAIVNRKGGSGKSTLATHMAAWLSRRGERVMLGDVDRQQSVVHWLRRREQHTLPGAPLVGWALDPRNVLRPPVGINHVVLDTPGGLQGFDLSRLLVHADLLLMPVCDSIFDRESAAACLTELRAHPRVAGGRVQIGVVGMRVDARTHGEQQLREWAEAQAVPFVGVLREARAYVRCAEAGLSVFDLPVAKVQADLAQWQPVLEWTTRRIAAEAAAVRKPGSGAAASVLPTAPMKPVRPLQSVRPVRPPQRERIERTERTERTEQKAQIARLPDRASSLRRLLGWLLLAPLLARARSGS